MGCTDRSFVNTSDRNKWRYLNIVSGGGINAARIASLVREGADGFSSQSGWSAWIYCPDTLLPGGAGKICTLPCDGGLTERRSVCSSSAESLGYLQTSGDIYSTEEHSRMLLR